ncbi:hypothetical protein [Curtobacterium sp. VKM Ac-2884]|uniref:hypothetical protein n=1 Tax=Curtobacterium sp. VKM Ac-2884 TaxID=2783818 RepID=UPI00188B2399|nr:hypothetical protein [Curtobacterium sp. VKM Ac-2884]MBF4603717.1 hypothetical protein [Curtobacterium sp. VKM Ac-2884]
MPSAVLRRADQITTTDVVLDAHGQPWNVHSIYYGEASVQLTLRSLTNEAGMISGLRYDAWVRLASVETPAQYRRRVARRGVPWFVAAAAVALWANVTDAPAFGGQVPAIVCLVAVAAIRMATTLERDR